MKAKKLPIGALLLTLSLFVFACADDDGPYYTPAAATTWTVHGTLTVPDEETAANIKVMAVLGTASLIDNDDPIYGVSENVDSSGAFSLTVDVGGQAFTDMDRIYVVAFNDENNDGVRDYVDSYDNENTKPLKSVDTTCGVWKGVNVPEFANFYYRSTTGWYTIFDLIEAGDTFGNAKLEYDSTTYLLGDK